MGIGLHEMNAKSALEYGQFVRSVVVWARNVEIFLAWITLSSADVTKPAKAKYAASQGPQQTWTWNQRALKELSEQVVLDVWPMTMSPEALATSADGTHFGSMVDLAKLQYFFHVLCTTEKQ